MNFENRISLFGLDERTNKMAKQLKERVQTGTDENGKPIYKWATGFTKQELLMNAAKLLCECGELTPQEKPASSKHLFKEYAQNWFLK